MKEIERKIKSYQEKIESIGTQCIESESLTNEFEAYKQEVFTHLTPWQRVQISRHQDRPRSSDFIRHICDDFIEMHGDRLFRDDPAIIVGFGYISAKKFVIIAQEKGNDTDSRLERNFGMPHPEGYRKALRLMQLAEKFHLPILTLIDTPGAHCGLEAEERGQGWAIAKNLWEMSRLKTPIINVLIGEGCSGGALGIGMGDAVAMLEHAYYSVISPEGCASILLQDLNFTAEASQRLRMHAEDLLAWKIVDKIIQEPLGGAHFNPHMVYSQVKDFILEKLEQFTNLEIEELLELRYQKFRQF